MKREELLNHDLVPKHVILSKEERKGVFKKYGIKKMEQFPRISESDPVIKAIGAKRGDLIKITRVGGLPKECIYYRVVVEV